MFKNILFIAVAIAASVIVFNYAAPTSAAAPDTEIVKVTCYVGNTGRVLNVQEALALQTIGDTYVFIDKRDGHKHRVPHTGCFLDYGKVQ